MPNQPYSSNNAAERVQDRPCGRCGELTYRVQVRRTTAAGVMPHGELNHFSDGSPVDDDCKRVLTKGGALAAWGRGRREDSRAVESRANSWASFAEYAESLEDSDPDVQFFADRGCFDPHLGDVFIPANVPPLNDSDDFLMTIGALEPIDGPTVMAALVRAVKLREA